MRVVYYTRPPFLDSALPFIRELSRHVELHLFLELAPEEWRSSLFDVAPKALPAGIIQADRVLAGCFPEAVSSYWKDTVSFNLVVHNSTRSIHPAAWWVSQKAAARIRRIRPQVLHLDDVSLRAAWALPLLHGLPMVLSLHDPEAHSGEGNWRAELARRVALARARRVILHNRSLRERFCDRYRVQAGKVDAIPLGVLDVFREWAHRSSPEDHTVLFFGRLSPYKGLEDLYKAACIVAEKVPGVRFVVGGKPVAGYEVPNAPQLPNGGNIETIYSYIGNEQLSELFHRATVVVCPYKDATQSGVVLTAYAFEKPVVATNVGGLAEYVQHGENGLLVPPGDSEALAEALVRVLTDEDLRGRLAQGVARSRSDELDWQSIVHQTIEAYSRAVETEACA